jgi:hypothetical protein
MAGGVAPQPLTLFSSILAGAIVSISFAEPSPLSVQPRSASLVTKSNQFRTDKNLTLFCKKTTAGPSVLARKLTFENFATQLGYSLCSMGGMSVHKWHSPGLTRPRGSVSVIACRLREFLPLLFRNKLLVN